MKDFKIDNKGSGRLFSSSFLERLTRTHFLFPVTLYYLAAITCVGYAICEPSISFLRFWWLFFPGMLLFSLVEYVIHRFLFHFNAKSPAELQLQYNIHGIHHEFPRDKERLVMPPVVSIGLATLFGWVFHLLMGGVGWIVFGGFLAGYSTYLVIHYSVHARRPPDNFLRYWWKHHSRHHYASVHSAFAVSMPLWDFVFGTMPPKSDTGRSGATDDQHS